MNHTGRNFSIGRSPRRILLRCLFIPLSFPSILLSSVPAFVACNRAEPPLPAEELTPQENEDSVRITLSGVSETEPAYLYIYRSTAPQNLVKTEVIRNEEVIHVNCLVNSEGPLLAVAVQGVQINPASVQLLGSMEELQVPFELERPECHIRSASCIIQGQETHMNLRPLGSRIIIRSITNNGPEFSLLENPRARIVDASAATPLLRWSGFRPSITTQTPWIDLPCDIGFYTQHPMTELYCYPSDEKNESSGTRYPSVEVEYSYNGCTHTQSFYLGPVCRDETRYVDIEIVP